MNRFALACLAASFLVHLSMARAEEAPAANGTASAPAASRMLTSLDIAIVDVDLRQPGLAVSAEPDPDLVNWHVPDISRLLRERGPLDLAANGLTGTVTLVAAPAAGTQPDLAALASGRPLLVLRVATITKTTPRLFTKAGQVEFEAQFFDTSALATPRWHALLGATQLGFDPVLGVLKTNRVDAAWTDRLLAFALDRLAQAGLVQLPGPKALSAKE